jgi:hypothetical protein
MAGRTPRRGASLGTRLAVIAGIALSVLFVTPGSASAHYGWIQPVVTCVTPVRNGTWTAVFGYTNTTPTTLTVSRGSLNDMTPDRFDGTQVTRFSPGTRQGAFSVQVPASITTVQWQVYGMYGIARRDGSTRCPSSTELPADGNGMGVVIALAAAGAVGGTSVYVSRRRREGGTPAPTAG